ncbi:4Fe-4S dicluster domain-containing protein [Methanobacterium sp. CWC-01]|uniref:ATP-binding protein n=1 Tax=Methanobacterium aridiramus TaxID=2584467 RepID=UPI002576C3E6|nr:ATP-binding protein [Methanobacterium sp. CWC-01]WJI09754.1 4Fe-4S dicluster domain-containing protein [Methanobacterium sp. CWC-01]
MKTITILSGKGGVGKSTLTSSLAVLLGKENKIVAVDCDVDAPNLGLVLGLEEGDFQSWESIKATEKAQVEKNKCKSRKACLSACKFGAINWLNEENMPHINDFLCVGCGACVVACPECAIEFKPVENAKIGIGETDYGFPVVSGQLKIGESGSGRVVDAVKNRAYQLAEDLQAEYLIVDSAAGIGCPVVASVRGSDYVIMVTEPTPVAFADFQRALEMVRFFGIPHGMVINRWDINEKFAKKIENYSRAEKIPLLGEIPYDKRFVEALINLKPAVVYEKDFEEIFKEILSFLPMLG